MTDYAPIPIELELLQKAFRNPSGISIGTITSKMGISIRDASFAFRNLRKQGFLREQGGTLLLTKRGRSWIMQNQHLFAFSGVKEWRTVPEEFLADRIQPFEPYAPLISKLNKAHFGLGGRKRG